MTAANKTLLLCVINPLYYGLTFWVYSCTICIPIMMAIIYVALQIYKTSNMGKEIMLAVVEGLLLVLGYEIRPIAIFPCIAIVIITVPLVIKHRIYKKIVRSALVMILISGIFYLGISQIKNSYFGEIAHLNYSITDYLLVGSHGNGDLSTILEQQEKNQTAIEQIITNYKESGVTGTINLWYRKTITTWADGYSSLNSRMTAGETDSYLFELIAGNHNQLYQIYSQAFRLITAIGIVLFCFRLWKRREFPELMFILLLTIFGGLVFYSLWEAKDVFSAPFLLIMLIVAQIGFSQFTDSMKENSVVTKNGQILIVSYLVLALFLCSSLYTVFGHETTFCYYRIRALANGRVNSIIESGNSETITQDFYVDRDFNEITLKADVEKDRQDISDYEISITDGGGTVLVKHTVNQADIKDGEITFRFDAISEDDHYYIIIQKQDSDLGSLYFYTKYNYYFDSYKGNLLVDGKDAFVNDLMMDVKYTSQETYFDKRMSSVVAGMFLLVSVGILVGLFLEEILFVPKKEVSNVERSEKTHE